MHVLGGIGSDRIDFLVLSAPAAPIFRLACKDDVGGVLVRELIVHRSDCWPSGRLLRSRRRRTSRWRRREPFAFGDSGEPVALPGCVVGRLRATVELAWGVEGLLVGEGRLPSRPAAFLLLGCGPPFGLLTLDRGHLPTGGRRQGALALVVVLVRASAEVPSRRLGRRVEYLPGRIYLELGLH